MKSKFIKLSAFTIVVVVLLSFGIFSACEESDDTNTNIVESKISLIDTTLGTNHLGPLGSSEDTLYLFNSNEELHAKLPEARTFDFTKGSLLIFRGHNTVTRVGSIVGEIEQVNFFEYILKIDITMSGLASPDSQKAYYWTTKKIPSISTITLQLTTDELVPKI
ncbi:MAG: hypothetical protein WC135_07500 [Bacteroidales bacterium]